VNKNLLIVLILGVFLTSIFSSYALAQVSINIEADKIYLTPGNFIVKITNDLGKKETFGISVMGPYRNWVYFDKSYITLYPGKSETISFNINFPEKTKSGIYTFPIFVYSLTDPKTNVEKNIFVFIEEKYKAAIEDIKTNKDSFSPNDIIKSTESVVNLGTRDFQELKLHYEITHDNEVVYKKDEKFSLEMGMKKTFEQEFKTDNTMSPGEYIITAYLMRGDDVLSKESKKISLETVEKVEKEYKSTWTPIGEFGKILITNVGNVKKTENIELKIKKPWDVFLTSSITPSKEDAGDYVVLLWPITLDVNESRVISYQIHYWPLILLAGLIIYGGYLTFKITRTPKVRKSAINIKALEDDKKEVMVAIEIKNVGEKLKDVVIEDVIPSIARLIKDFKTKKPIIKKTKDGTKLIWKLGRLEKHEDIILTYKFETLIGTLDYIRLPRVKLIGKTKDRTISVNSNELRIKEEE